MKESSEKKDRTKEKRKQETRKVKEKAERISN